MWNMNLQLRQLEHLGSIRSQLLRQIKCLLIGSFCLEQRAGGGLRGTKLCSLASEVLLWY